MRISLYLLFFVSLCVGNSFAQDPMRGPSNILQGGIVDGVIITDEVPLRSKVEYEYVRPSDYVWSKRVFSRIDAREKINFEIFFPLDSFKADYVFPQKRQDVDAPEWCKNQSRNSLWTIISKHVMLGDLTIFRVNSPLFEEVVDGHSFKYPILKQSKDDFFTSVSYRNAVTDNIIALRSAPDIYTMMDDNNIGKTFTRTDKPFKTGDPNTGWLDSLIQDFTQNLPELVQKVNDNESLLETYWNAVMPFELLQEPPKTAFISSESIIAYYIKEDWYFDKERSVLDKRIIGIAPVMYFKNDPKGGVPESPVLIENGIYYELGPKGKTPFSISDTKIERELFWLYFDELRNVLVNYYVYNDKNDAQWMSFDDLFWKRKYAATIYKVSDKFDREIEDYKFGVEALYEAERVKESIRDWEHDLWNY
jgi:hypothetical protein